MCNLKKPIDISGHFDSKVFFDNGEFYKDAKSRYNKLEAVYSQETLNYQRRLQTNNTTENKISQKIFKKFHLSSNLIQGDTCSKSDDSSKVENWDNRSEE